MVVLEVRLRQQVLVFGAAEGDAGAEVVVDGRTVNHTGAVVEGGVEGLHLVALFEGDERFVAVAGVAVVGVALLEQLLSVLVGVGLPVVGLEVDLVQQAAAAQAVHRV